MLTFDKVEAPLLAELQLPVGALVLVVGAYKGDTVKFIAEHHPTSRIYAVEPQEWAYQELLKLQEELVQLRGVTGAALVVEDTDERILYEYGTDACSLIKLPNSRVEGVCKTVGIFDFTVPDPIELLIMNIEGYEYTLLPVMVNRLDVSRILVQYHMHEKYSLERAGIDEFNLSRYRKQDVGSGWVYYER